jgi:ERCC4-type nuclease
MEFHLDSREVKLKELLHDTITHTSNLEHGDIQFIYNNLILLVIERKSINDLLASVHDGRYKNQKKRLLESFETKQIYYIIEGFTTDKIAISCILNTMIRDNIKIFRTNDVADSALLLRNIYTRLSENPQKYITTQNITEQVIKTRSKDISHSKIFQSILEQIPGISQKTSKAIVDKYKCFKCLIDDLDKAKVLKDIKLDNKRISSTAVTNIIKYLEEKFEEN